MFGLPQTELKIVAPDGNVRSAEKGLIDSKQATIPNKAAVIHVGDEIRRTLPSGIEETFEVVDPVYYPQLHGIPAHYQVKIRRKGIYPVGTGGHFTFNVSGPNARVNIGSNDHSKNVVADKSVFGKLSEKIQIALPDSEDRSRMLQLIEGMEKNIGNQPAFISAYQNFISSAANHMTLIAPFLPALTNFLS
jgi:hypothetical protein